MNLFKNFKTKKQLRAEIERLKTLHERTPIIEADRMEIKELCASCIVDAKFSDDDHAEAYTKRIISDAIRRKMIPYIEYSAEDCREGKIYRGMLRVVGRKL